ncbi:MAG: nucleotide exchange factor GrpE [Dehalococcoidia bacterium]|nr:nucleotide exchange factor GrpE [Dehalococcoidia bacterium]
MSEPGDDRTVETTESPDERTVSPEALAADPADSAASDPASQLEAERERAESYYRNWQRTAADFANYKRRVEQERSESQRLANAALVINLLPVFDDLDRAVASVDSHLAGLNWVQGIINIHQKFWRLLEAMGVSEIPAEGARFDPACHEAIARQAGPEGRVLHVVQKGYNLGGKVLRPAMVIVGDGTTPEAGQSGT